MKRWLEALKQSEVTRRPFQELVNFCISKHYVDYVLIFILAFIVCRQAFKPGYLFGHDAGTSLKEAFIYRQNGFLTIDEYWYLGHNSVFPYGNVFRNVLLGYLTLFFNGDFVFVSKLETFSMFVLSGLSMYQFMRFFSDNHRIPSLISAISYMLSPVIFTELVYEGHTAVAWGIALAPLLLLAFGKAVRSSRISHCILAGLVYACFIGMTNTSMILMFSVFLFFYLGYQVVLNRGSRIQILKKVFKTCLISGLVAGLLSTFWLAPFISQIFSPIVPEFEYSAEFFRDHSPNPLQALTLSYRGGCGPQESFSPLGSSTVMNIRLIDWQWDVLGLWIPILAILGYHLKRDRRVLFFLLAAFVTIYFAKGAHPPLEQPLVWCYLNVPFFSSIRSGVRYLAIMSLCYSVLHGVAAERIYAFFTGSEWVRKLRVRQISKICVKRLGFASVSIIIFLIFFYSWIPLTSAVKTFNLPATYDSDEAYEWIAQQNSTGRVMNYPGTAWVRYEEMSSDWDIRSYKNLGTILPIVDYNLRILEGASPQAWPRLTEGYTNYLWRLIETQTCPTGALAKILAHASIEYIVIDLDHPKIEDSEVDFWRSQDGLNEVEGFRSKNTIVLKNDQYLPILTTYPASAVIISGRDAFSSLSNVDGFEWTDWAFIFSEQLNGYSRIMNIVGKSDLIIFSEPDFLDFFFMTSGCDYRITAAEYGFRSSDSSQHWILTDQGVGGNVLDENNIRTRGNVNLTIPFHVQNDGEYDIWIRKMMHGPEMGTLAIEIDGVKLPSIYHNASLGTHLSWVNFGMVPLKKGSHMLTLSNVLDKNRKGENIVNAIGIVPSPTFQTILDKAQNLPQDYLPRIMYVLEAEYAFNGTNWNVMNLTDINSNNASAFSKGYALTSNTTSNALMNMFIPYTGKFMVKARTFVGPEGENFTLYVDGTQSFVVDNAISTPGFVWHKIGPMELDAGLHVLNISNDESGETVIDKIVIYQLFEDENDNISLGEILVAPQTVPVEYEEINSCEYQLHLNSEFPFWMVFRNSFDPLWRAYLGNEQIEPVIASSCVNGFYVNRTGEINIRILYLGQTIAHTGGIISSVTLIITVMSLVYLKLRRKENKY